jgi:hypothetical protein
MFKLKVLWGVWAALIFSCNTVAEPSNLSPTVIDIDAPTKVLFIGNSYSYYNNGIATLYSNLVRASGLWRNGEFSTRQKTISGGRLVEHLAGFSELLTLPNSQSWNVVVLQEYSNGPIKNSSSATEFQHYSSELAKVIREHHATPVFFMTWAYKGNKAMVQQLRDAYVAQANKLNILVVPVGLAFADSQEKFPAIELYSKDVQGTNEQGQVVYSAVEKHPSLAGSYLAACVFYATLQGKSPAGISYTADLSYEQARQLQNLAWQTTQQFLKTL